MCRSIFFVISLLLVISPSLQNYTVMLHTGIKTVEGPDKGKRNILYTSYADIMDSRLWEYVFKPEDNIIFSENMKNCFTDLKTTEFEPDKAYNGILEVPKDIWVTTNIEGKPNDVIVSCEDVREGIIVKDGRLDSSKTAKPVENRIIL